MQTFTEGPYSNFSEETTDALLDKEYYLVALGTADGTVKLATSVDDAMGVLFAKREGDPQVTVRLLGKGGTVKVKAGGVIAKDARVIWGTGGKVITRPTSAGIHRTLGRKLTQGNSADGDIIEIVDLVESAKVVTVVALASTNGTAGAAIPGALTSTNGTAAAASADLAALAAEAEKIGDDVRAVHAAALLAQAEAEKIGDDVRAIHAALVSAGIIAAS